jgi:hypothetical protein
MPDIDFAVVSASADAGALTPLLRFGVELRESSGAAIDTVSLSCQIMIEAKRRSYTAREQEALLDLFGERTRWGTTLKTMLWTHTGVMVAGFHGETVADLEAACGYDLGVAATKYFYALEDGEVPLAFQFSGTIFYRDEDGALQITRIPWSKEARFALPVRLWHELMQVHTGGDAWLRLRGDVFDRLYRYKARRGVPTWEALFDDMLRGAEETAST